MDNGVACSYEDAARIITQYDEDGNGRLNFDEFCQLCLPSTDNALRSYALSKNSAPYAPRRTFLSASVEFNLARVFQGEIDYQRAIGSLRRDLNLRYDFSTSAAFSMLDRHVPINKLDRYEIRDFVELYSGVLSEPMLDGII